MVFPEIPLPQFVVYNMAHIPFDVDMIRLFNSRIGQSLSSSTYDFNNDGIVNMRDIATTIRKSVLLSS